MNMSHGDLAFGGRRAHPSLSQGQITTHPARPCASNSTLTATPPAEPTHRRGMPPKTPGGKHHRSTLGCSVAATRARPPRERADIARQSGSRGTRKEQRRTRPALPPGRRRQTPRRRRRLDTFSRPRSGAVAPRGCPVIPVLAARGRMRPGPESRHRCHPAAFYIADL